MTEGEIAARIAIPTVGNMTPDEAAAYGGLYAAMWQAHKTATDAGWYTDPETGEPKQRNFGEVLMLMVSELSEALEADRKGLMDDKLVERDGREVEFADALIREFDTAGAQGRDIPGAFIEVKRLLETHSMSTIRFTLLVFKLADWAAAIGLDMPGAYIEKNRYNQRRQDHKLENRAQAGGKKY